MMVPRMDRESARLAARRVMDRADQLAAISENPEHLTRVYLSSQHLEANRMVAEWMRSAGMDTWQDAVGNICGRYEGKTAGAPAILLGSHLDTVRNAGRYDGMLGVLCALEVVAFLHQQSVYLKQAIEVIGFSDEEGTRFGITLLGSRGLTGSWPENWLACEDADGISVAAAMSEAGFDPQATGLAERPVGAFSAYLELHIEQGPVLEEQDLALGIVTAINGARRLNCTFKGEAGHAGTVPMILRKDALAAAAEWMYDTEMRVRGQDTDMVATVGTLRCLPGAVNVISGEVQLTLDIRSPQDSQLENVLQQILIEGERIALRRGMTFTAETYYAIPATPCDPKLQGLLNQAVGEVQGQTLSLPSGAGHDVIAMAERWPCGMLFVRCKKGISHHPAESVSEEDVAMAIQAFSLATGRLNAEA